LLNGGAEAKTIRTVCGLEGYEFVVGHGAAYAESQVQLLAERGIESRRFSTLRHYNPVTAVPAVIAIASYLRKHDFDIVHTHSTEAGIIGRLAATLAGVPNVVHTVHGVPFAEDRSSLLNRFVLACERLTAPLADRLVTNAEAIATEYVARDIGQPDQYATVYSGIDLERFASAEPAPDLPETGPVVLFVGRLVEGKGFSVLLDAVERIDIEFSLCLAGDGPLRERLAADIEARGLGDHVHLLGYREDVERLVAGSNVLVLPSFREGTPRVITEAMAGGLPVVASNIAGIPEQIDDGGNGLLVPPGDPDALADALESVLENPQLRVRMGDQSTTRATRFSEAAMVEDLDEVYRDLLSTDR
jgi:glycosyltransferase involved in cell wall biosynthesis